MSDRSIPVQIAGLAGWIALSFVAAAVGAVASASAGAFYGELARPAWAPPAWLFGPVWTLLYLSMAVAAWLVWRAAPLSATRLPLGLFVVQLAANALWSWLFFAWRQGGWAFAEVVVLWLLIAATALAFRRVNPLAAALLLPYLAWVTFAAALNWTLWTTNRGLLG